MRRLSELYRPPRQWVEMDGRRTHLSRAASTARPEFSQLALGVSVALLVLLAAARGPVVLLQLMAVILVVALTLKRPEHVLALGVAGTLAGGAFNQVSAIGGLVLMLGGCTSLFILGTSHLQVRWQRLALPVLILLWLGFRVSLEHDFSTASATVRCVSVLPIVLHCLQARRDAVVAMAGGGMLFVASSAVLGTESPGGLRFEGISGNPNRMVFGLLLYLPFFCAVLVRLGRPLLKILTLVTIVAAVTLVLRSGSAQGTAGLGVTVVILVLCWASGLPYVVRAMALLIIAAATLLTLDSAIRLIESSEDLRTLSGRTSIYSAARRDIARHPLAGSGQQHFSEGTIMDRSAHSVVLGMTATGGLLLGLAWIAVLVMLLTITIVLIRRRSPLAAAPAALITEQFVQTVQLAPLTWAIIALFLVVRSPEEFGEPPPLRTAERTALTGDASPVQRRFTGPHRLKEGKG